MNVSFFSRADARLARVASAAPRMLAMVMSAVALGASAQGLVVSESGQAVYSYPIVVPPGVAGMEPKLSLVYNSGGMNGPMGVGWSVQGISQITRCPKIEPVPVGASYKPRIVPVAYGPDDNLCLDGQRLVQIELNERRGRSDRHRRWPVLSATLDRAACRPASRPNTMQRVRPCCAKPPCDSPAQ